MSTSKSNKPKIVVICGPTGSGKTSLAVSLCKKFDGEIVNADSRQVYREMDIGTGKELDDTRYSILDIEGEEKNIPASPAGGQYPLSNISDGQDSHFISGIRIHLVDIVNPTDKYTVGRFKKDATSAIESIISKGKIPFIVGGTGLYIDALVDNFQLPEEITNYKLQIIKKPQTLNDKNIEELIKELEKLDPQALSIVDLKNRRRVERAIEVTLSTGIPFSKQRTRGERKYEVLKLAPAVSLDREKLYEKINTRVDQMIADGLEEEVKILADKYGWESEAMTGIGYKEWRSLFVNLKSQISNLKKNSNDKSQITKDIIEQIKLSTKKYAKRQMTWFKRDKEINYIDQKEAEKLVKKFFLSSSSS
jgi:tRNA dimethylallyltransferase